MQVDHEPNGYLGNGNEDAEPTKPPESPRPVSHQASPAAVAAAAAAAAATEDHPSAADGAGMDVDGDVAEAVEDVCVEDDDAPAPELDARMTLTLTNGHSVGVQSEWVTELGPETIILALPDKNVMHTTWNPRDAAVLATGGHPLCRIWTIPPALPPTADPSRSHGPNPNGYPYPDGMPYVDMFDVSAEVSMVTTMAWAPDGGTLAVATRDDQAECAGAVSLWSKDGKSLDDLPSAPDMVLKFRWNPSGTYLLGLIASAQGRSALVVWDLRIGHALDPFELDHAVIDAAWSSDRQFTVCGHHIVAEVEIDGERIIIHREYTQPETNQPWTHIEFDPVANTRALAAEETAMLGIINGAGHLRTTVAHEAEITALTYQPVPDPSSYSSTAPRLLVTSSLDSQIKVWDATDPFQIIHTFGLGPSTPAMAISFAPDGHLIAAANGNRILIWNATAGGMPTASWTGDGGHWQPVTHGIDHDSGTGEEEDGSTHCLSWDADGTKLAYGLGSQVRLILLAPRHLWLPPSLIFGDQVAVVSLRPHPSLEALTSTLALTGDPVDR